MADNETVGTVLFIISVLGVFFNWTVILCQKRVLCLKQSFGLITRNQAIGDAIQSTTVLFLVSPMIIFEIEVLLNNSSFISFSLLLGYEISVLSHFLLSINRFWAVMVPLKYEKWFSKSTTDILLTLVNLYAVTTCFLYYASGCHYYWNNELWMFMYHILNKCDTISFYGLFCKYFFIIILVLLLDLVTAYKGRKLWMKVLSRQSSAKRKRNTKNLYFLIQTCAQGALFGMELVSYFVISPHVDNKWIRFSLTTVMFCLIHCLDGALSIICNREFRVLIHRMVLKKNSAVKSDTQPRI